MLSPLVSRKPVTGRLTPSAPNCTCAPLAAGTTPTPAKASGIVAYRHAMLFPLIVKIKNNLVPIHA